MRFIDTHCHLCDVVYKEDLAQVVAKAQKERVYRIYMPSTDADNVPLMQEVKRQYSDVVRLMVGLHPIYVKADFKSQLNRLKAYLDKGSFVAVGEIGMDLYHDKTFLVQQQEAFKEQLDWSLEKGLPINIHCRDAFEETFEILDAYRGIRGIFHCFTGDLAQAKHIVSTYGFKLGIGGIVTFKNGGLDKFLHEIPLEHIVLETDGPYLSPMPFRGKRNEPSYIPLIAKKMASIHGVSLEEVAEITTNNALEVFGEK